MINIEEVLKNYDKTKLTIGVLGGHSALDVCAGATKMGFDTVAVCQKGREKTYTEHYKRVEERGCVGNTIVVDSFADIVKPEVQDELRALNTIFVHNRYFWVYCNFEEIEKDFNVPIYGTRDMLKLEERDVELNQYELLELAGIRTPKILRPGASGITGSELTKLLDKHFAEDGSPLIVKVNEAHRGYERAFFTVTSTAQFQETSTAMLEKGTIIQEDLDNAVIEEFVIGAQVNFNFFYSPLNDRIELMGTDMRRQTSLDGFLRLDAKTQTDLLDNGYKPSMVENGHVAITIKESLIEKAYIEAEKFVAATKKHCAPGIIGPFALQGAVASYEGREEIVIFDVSMRIPGSPGTAYTPYTNYMYGKNLSYGERIAMEIAAAAYSNKLEKLLT
jgi:5-formaminoimidazole-4-carboxamide-1-(beta)-D-ribofuranosyl 5'-monophosphate synthetase